jgi:hypothetical protein
MQFGQQKKHGGGGELGVADMVFRGCGGGGDAVTAAAPAGVLVPLGGAAAVAAVHFFFQTASPLADFVL